MHCCWCCGCCLFCCCPCSDRPVRFLSVHPFRCTITYIYTHLRLFNTHLAEQLSTRPFTTPIGCGVGAAYTVGIVVAIAVAVVVVTVYGVIAGVVVGVVVFAFCVFSLVSDATLREPGEFGQQL